MYFRFIITYKNHEKKTGCWLNEEDFTLEELQDKSDRLNNDDNIKYWEIEYSNNIR